MVVEVAFGSVRVAHYERRTAPLEVSNIRPPFDKRLLSFSASVADVTSQASPR
jgi:hypothetical protein